MKNVTSVEVLLSGVRVGELVSVPRRGTFFAYDEQWLATGFNLSPLNMEFKSAPQAAPDLHLFGGLMGVFADSLPDGCLPFMQGGCTQLLQSPSTPFPAGQIFSTPGEEPDFVMGFD